MGAKIRRINENDKKNKEILKKKNNYFKFFIKLELDLLFFMYICSQ